MAKTKDLRKKSFDLMDFSDRRTDTAVRAHARSHTFDSIIQLGRYASHCKAFSGIRSIAKTIKALVVTVIKKKLVWSVRPVRIRIATGNKLTSLCYSELKRHQMLHC